MSGYILYFALALTWAGVIAVVDLVLSTVGESVDLKDVERMFVQVDADDWCGQFDPKLAPPAPSDTPQEPRDLE